MIRLVVVAPTLAVRAGLRALLFGADAPGSGQGLDVIGEAASLADLQELPPGTDVLLLAPENLARSDLEGVLQESEGVAVLLLVGDEINAARVFSGLRLRAWGVLPLDSAPEELLAAINALYEGLIVGAPSLVEPLFVRYTSADQDSAGLLDEPLIEPLTDRETQVLQLLAQGLPNKQIALELGISEHTVKFHVSAIYAKLGAANRTEAVRVGVRQGLIVL